MGAAEALGGSIHDRLKYPIRVLVQLAVPDAKNRPTLLFEEAVALLIMLRSSMLAAIHLDDQLCLSAGEVREVRPDWQFARELRAQA